jgi:hypothetical protein
MTIESPGRIGNAPVITVPPEVILLPLRVTEVIVVVPLTKKTKISSPDGQVNVNGLAPTEIAVGASPPPAPVDIVPVDVTPPPVTVALVVTFPLESKATPFMLIAFPPAPDLIYVSSPLLVIPVNP